MSAETSAQERNELAFPARRLAKTGTPDPMLLPESLRISARHLRQGYPLHWPNGDDTTIALIYGEGSGCHAEVPEGGAAVWIPLRGALQLTTRYSTHALGAREVAVTTCLTTARVRTHPDSRWLATMGSQRAWALLLAGTPAAYRQLLPAHCAAGHTLRRAAIAVARATDCPQREDALRAMADVITRLQAPLHDALERCPGRTYAQRRQVFMRLQRVRIFMTTCCEREVDNDLLSRMANYSTHHFLRTFKSVYRETPHTYLVKQRLQKAQRLLRESRLSVTEVALASGFENPSAFSRLFHRNFGVTARETKLRLKTDADC